MCCSVKFPPFIYVMLISYMKEFRTDLLLKCNQEINDLRTALKLNVKKSNLNSVKFGFPTSNNTHRPKFSFDVIKSRKMCAALPAV
jgi:hypothetical protein